jgi:hypothetical protein
MQVYIVQRAVVSPQLVALGQRSARQDSFVSAAFFRDSGSVCFLVAGGLSPNL